MTRGVSVRGPFSVWTGALICSYVLALGKFLANYGPVIRMPVDGVCYGPLMGGDWHRRIQPAVIDVREV